MNAIERINFTLSNYYHDGYQKQNYPIHFSSDEQAKKVVAKILLDDVSQLTSANCTPEQSHWVLSTIKNRLVNIFGSQKVFLRSESIKKEISFHDVLLSKLWSSDISLDAPMADNILFAAQHHLWDGLHALLKRLSPQEQKDLPMSCQTEVVSLLQHHMLDGYHRGTPSARASLNILFSNITAEDIQSHKSIHPLCAFLSCDSLSDLMKRGVVETPTVLKWIETKKLKFMSEIGRGLVQFWSEHGQMSSPEIGKHLSQWAYQDHVASDVFRDQGVRIHCEGSFFDQWSMSACRMFQSCIQGKGVGDRNRLLKNMVPATQLPHGGTEGSVLLFIALATGEPPSWIKQQLSFWANGSDEQSINNLWSGVWGLLNEPFLQVSSISSAKVNYASNVAKGPWWFSHNLAQRQDLFGVLSEQVKILPLWDNPSLMVSGLSQPQRKVVGAFIALAYKRHQQLIDDVPLSSDDAKMLLDLLLRKAPNIKALMPCLVSCAEQKVISVSSEDLEKIVALAPNSARDVLRLSTASLSAAAPSSRSRRL